ncbi:MAG: hypothetical protein JW863_10270 [Chitinispirillaceae bacterium]|nr:hypothetical protein [Chitinispirillaceae bacterium]
MTFVSAGQKRFLRNGAFLMAIAAAGNFIAYKIVHIPTQLELVVLMTAALTYPIIRKPAIGIYLMFTLMPFVPHVRRLYYLVDQRPKVDPLIAAGDIIIAITFVGLFFVFREQRNEENRAKGAVNLLLTYFIYLILRTFFLNSLPVQEAVMRFHFYGPAVLFFFIGILYARNIPFLKSIWYLSLMVGVVGALYGFKQLLFGYSNAEQIWFSSISFTTLFIKGLARPFSVFQSPASFADYMLLSIIGTLMIHSWSTSRWRIGFLLLIPLYFYGALLTSVRSNWIGILLALGLWVVLLQIRGKRNRILMITGLFLFFILSQLLDLSSQYNVGMNALFSSLGSGFDQKHMELLVTERTSAISNPFEEYSFLSRVNLWKYILSMSVQPVNALLGKGVGAFNADSLYFTYLAELGYPGLLFIIGITVFLILRGFHLLDTTASPVVRSLAKGITLMNIVFAVVNVTGTHIHSFPADIYYWFWNGVLVKLASEPDFDPDGQLA